MSGQDVDNAGLVASVKYVVCQFMDDDHYTMLHRALSQRWDRMHSLSAAMKLLETYGVVISPDEADRLSTMDEGAQINELVSRMPQQSKEQFQQFFLQLQLIVSTATRVRKALEEGEASQVEEALGDADSTGIAPYILKMVLVQAGSEVHKLRTNYQAFLKDTDLKMSKLLRGQEDAMHAQQKLAAAQAQLASYTQAGNEKAKKVLMNMAGGSTSVLIQAAFHGWEKVWKQNKVEAGIRAEYEDRIQLAEKRLFEFREAQLGNVRGVMAKKGAGHDLETMHFCFDEWKRQLDEAKWNKENAGKIKELEEKLHGAMGSQQEATMKVMMRMGAANDESLVLMIWQGWLQFSAEYKKDKDLEDAVKAEEKRIAEFMKNHSENSKSLLSSMSSGTDSGLLHEVLSAWNEFLQDAKKEREFEDIMNKQGGKFKSFHAQNKDSANSVMNKASYFQDLALMLQTFNAWRLEGRHSAVSVKYQAKIEGKRQQLMGVQQMFRNFATQLESGLKEGADSNRDLHNRIPQPMRRLNKGADGSVSLPDIHKSGGSATPKLGTPKPASASRSRPDSAARMGQPREAWQG